MKTRLLIATLFAALVTAFAAVPAHAMEVAVEDETVLLHGSDELQASLLGQAKALHASWLRVQVPYSDFQAHRLPLYDRLVNRARSRGFKIQMVLLGDGLHGPKWSKLRYYNPSAARFASYSRAVTRHFKGRVFRWSIWNEPNLSHFLGPQRRAGAIYRALYLAGYKAVKGVDRRNKVFIAELSPIKGSLKLMDKIGTGLKADGFAYHPYQFFKAPGRPDTRYTGISNVATIKATVKRLARQGRIRTPQGGTPPIYFTEFGYVTNTPYAISERTRAIWAPKAVRLARAAGIRQMSWYGLLNVPDVYWNSGVVNGDGSLTATFSALRKAFAAAG